MLTALLLSASLASQTAALPPAPEFRGASRALIAAADDPWITPAEKTGLRATPRYDETVAYLRRLVAAAPQLRMISIGKSGEGRELWMVIASKERAFTPDALRRTGKATVLAQAGIHAGEIDGKDAGLMLLRDMTVRGTKRELLDRANFLFVPIYNADGHERFSRFSRINQRGPEESGWRTTARNLNLNRDYVKADLPETRAMIRALREWQPDLYIDLHVTDGADYQYDVTYGWNGPAAHSPAIATWLDRAYKPAIDRALTDAGHVPGPFIFTADPFQGISLGPADPRLSHGYGDARHLPTVLVENHSLKPYDQRVLGMYVFLEQTLRTIGSQTAALREAMSSDRARRPATVPFSWRVPANQSQTIELLGIEAKRTLSPVTGDVRIEWTGKPVTARVPFRDATEVATSAARPKAYWIPPQWDDVIANLDLHGIQYERIAAPREVEVTMDRFSDVKYAAAQFEGHVRVTAAATPERRRETFAAGSVRVPTDQPLGTLAVILLEPSSPDSLFQWGWFHSILAQTEYVEAYIMEPMAERMLADDPQLAEEYFRKVESDEAFRADSRARLQWLYQRTPFYDERARLYPVGRE
jgi:Zinc carboxypeptidase